MSTAHIVPQTVHTMRFSVPDSLVRKIQKLIQNPEIFQGNRNRKFESGNLYFRCCFFVHGVQSVHAAHRVLASVGCTLG